MDGITAMEDRRGAMRAGVRGVRCNQSEVVKLIESPTWRTGEGGSVSWGVGEWWCEWSSELVA